MGWDSAPPTKGELANAAASASWNSAPPTDEEIAAARGRATHSPTASVGRKFAQAAAGNFSDEMSGGLDAVGRALGLDGLGSKPVKDISIDHDGPTLDWEKIKAAYKMGRDHERQMLSEDSKDHPALSKVAEVVGGVASPINKLTGGMGLAKAGAVYGGVAGLGGSDSEDVAGMAKDAALGAGTGAILGKGLDKIGKVLSPVVKEGMTLVPKENAAEIIAAAKRLGVEPTPGMLFENPVVGGLESSLSQSPSMPGMLMRRATVPVEKSIDKTAEAALADASAVSPYASGQLAKAGIEKAVTDKFAPSRQAFEELSQATPHMEVDPKSLARVGKNINKIEGAQLMPGSAGANKAAQYAEWLQNAKTVDQVKKIRQAIGSDLADATGSEKQILGDMYARVSRLEQNSMMRSAIDVNRSFARSATGKTGDAMAEQGEEIGKDMVAQLKGANKSYSQGMNDLGEVTKNAGLKKSFSPDQFAEHIKGLDSERVADTLYNPGDYRMMQTMQKQFPKEAEILRQAQLENMKTAASKGDGELSTPNFYRKTNKLGEEAKNALFGGDKVGQIKDAQTLMSALPEYIGKSGTPKGMEYLHMLNPLKNLADVGRYATYKTLVGLGKISNSKAAAALAEHVSENPELVQLAQKSPKAFEAAVIRLLPQFEQGAPAALPKAASNDQPANELDNDSSRSSNYNDQKQGDDMKSQPKPSPTPKPKKGPDKWASDGADNIAAHEPDHGLDVEAAMQDPKSKALLIAASDMKPKSKAMAEILSKLKSKQVRN